MADLNQYIFNDNSGNPEKLIEETVSRIRKAFKEYAGKNIANLPATKVAGLRFFHGGIEGLTEILQDKEQLLFIFRVAFNYETNEIKRLQFINDIYKVLLELKSLITKYRSREAALTPDIIDQAMLWIESLPFNETKLIREVRSDSEGLHIHNNLIDTDNLEL